MNNYNEINEMALDFAHDYVSAVEATIPDDLTEVVFFNDAGFINEIVRVCVAYTDHAQDTLNDATNRNDLS